MKTLSVNFHNHNLVCVVDANDIPHVAIAPICEAIGLYTDRAIRSIKLNPILAPDTSIQTYQIDETGQKREYFCLPLHMINGWLFNINPNKVSTKAKEKLITYQRECYKVLFNHFFGKIKTIINRLERQHQIDVRLKEIKQTVNILMAEYGTLEREHKQLTANNYAQLGLEFPPAPEKQYALEN